MSLLGLVRYIKVIVCFFTGSEEVMIYPESFPGIKYSAHRSQAVELCYEVRCYSCKVVSGFLNILLMDRDRNILILNDGIGTCSLIKKYPVVFTPVIIKAVTLELHHDLFFKVCLIELPVVYSDLGCSTAIQGIKEIRILKEHHLLVFAGSHSIVYILKLEHDRKQSVFFHEYSIFECDPHGEDILHDLRYPELHPVLFDRIRQCPYHFFPSFNNFQ